jgi:L-lactate dehydrogenase complex protein LldG
MEDQALISLFKEKAAAVQTVVADVAGLEDAFRYAVALTVRQGGKSLAAPGLDPQDRTELSRLCRESRLEFLSDDLRRCLTGIHTGFTVVDWAIAETATLVLDSRSEDIRIATMLSETHVALLPRSRIRPDAMDLEEELNRLIGSARGYLAFISGASRTADIERVLTIGVHGPKELHVLILNDAA